MGLTHFPNGVTTQAASAENSSAGAGDLNCQDLFVDGNSEITGNLNVTGYINGDVISQLISFGTGSAAQVLSAGTPTFACQLIGAIVTVGSVSAVAAAYTVQGGSAGTVHVSSEANTVTDSYAKEALAIDSAAISTAAGLKITRAAQGTAGDTSLLLLFKRTA